MKLTRDKISKLRRVKNQSYRRFHRKKNSDVTTTTFRKNNRAIEQLFKTVKHYVDKKFIEKYKKERIRKRLLKLQKQLGGGDGDGGGDDKGTETEISAVTNVIAALEPELANQVPASDNVVLGAVTSDHAHAAADVIKSNKKEAGNKPNEDQKQGSKPASNSSESSVVNQPPSENLPVMTGDVVLSVEKIKVDEHFTASKVLKAENKIVQINKDNEPILISGFSDFTINGLLYGKYRPPPREGENNGEGQEKEFDLNVGLSVGIGTKTEPDGTFIRHSPDVVKKITDKSSDVSIKVTDDSNNEEVVNPGQIYYINDNSSAAIVVSDKANKIDIGQLTTKDTFRILLTPYEPNPPKESPTQYFYNIHDGEVIKIVYTLKTLFEEIRKEMADTKNDNKEKTKKNLEKLLEIVKERKRKQDSKFIDAVKEFKYTAGNDPYGIQTSFKSIKESGLTAHISNVISIENELGIGEQKSEFFPKDEDNMEIVIKIGNKVNKNLLGEIEALVGQFEKIAEEAKQKDAAEQEKKNNELLEEMGKGNDPNSNKPKGGAKRTSRTKTTSHKKTRKTRKTRK